MTYFSEHNFSYNGKVVTEMTRNELILAVIDLGQHYNRSIQRETTQYGTPRAVGDLPPNDRLMMVDEQGRIFAYENGAWVEKDPVDA